MTFFRNSKDDTTNAATSTATWQSIASVDSALLTSSTANNQNNNDDDAFLNPSAPSNTLSSTAWSQERTSQHNDFRNEALGGENNGNKNRGCCSKLAEYSIKTLHGIDASLGLAGIIYGSLLCTQFAQPAMAASLFCLIFGSVHFSSSLLGILSFTSMRCSRCGLVASAFVAPYIAFVYFTILIALLADSSGLFSYLEDHKSVMYLGEDVVENLERLMPLLYVLLAVFSVAEVYRFSVLRNLRQQLLLDDAAIRFDNSGSSGGNNNLTEALLGSKDGNRSLEAESVRGEGDDSTTNSNWWENGN